jgi:hypothetical protein
LQKRGPLEAAAESGSIGLLNDAAVTTRRIAVRPGLRVRSQLLRESCSKLLSDFELLSKLMAFLGGAGSEHGQSIFELGLFLLAEVLGLQPGVRIDEEAHLVEREPERFHLHDDTQTVHRVFVVEAEATRSARGGPHETGVLVVTDGAQRQPHQVGDLTDLPKRRVFSGRDIHVGFAGQTAARRREVTVIDATDAAAGPSRGVLGTRNGPDNRRNSRIT